MSTGRFADENEWRETIDKRRASGAFLAAMAMSDNEIVAAARLFHSDDPEIARRLGLQRFRSHNVAAGETIFEPRQEADCVFLLAGGREAGQGAPDPLVQVRLAGEGTGRGPRYARIVRGDVFGEAELLSAGLDPRPSTRNSMARALTPGRVIGVPWPVLTELFELDPAIRTRFLKLATGRLLEAVAAQHTQGREDPDIVLADWLVEFAADLGVSASNRVSFPKKLNQTEIADELGVSRETISRRLKEWERSGLISFSGSGLEVVDYLRLVRIAGLHSGRDRDALSHAVADVTAEINRGDLIKARNIGADMLRYFPSSPELLHAMALAAARSGDPDEAVALLKGARLTPEGDLEALRGRVARALKNPFAPVEKIAAGDDWIDQAFDENDDEPGEASPREVEALTADMAALEARLLKDQAFEMKPEGDPAMAAQSRRAYEAVWRWAGNWYTGINAAAMALVAGDSDGAKSLAGEVLKRLPTSPHDYWAATTRAEALLISGDSKGGVDALAQAAIADDATDSARASTALQLVRLGPRVGLDVEEVRKQLGVKSVTLVTGHLFRGGEMDAATQTKAAQLIRERAIEIFAEQNVGNVFGALACGTDIVVAEAALESKIPFHAVIPFPLARFAELSVDIGDPPGGEGSWRKRYDEVLSHAASLTIVDDELPLDRDLDGHFYCGFRFMAGQALIRAGLLQAECRLIAATDGAGAVSLGGTGQAMADWLAAGRSVDTIVFPHPRKPPATTRGRGASSFRAVVLLWDVAGTRADHEAIKVALKAKHLGAKKAEFQIVARASRVGGEGTAIVAPTLEAAIRFAEACSAASEAGTLRIVSDFGPVLGADMQPDEKMIARLKAGSDMPGFPSGRPLATLSFAAQAVAEFGARLDVRAVGRTEETHGESDPRARRKSGLPVYRIAFMRQ